MTRPEWCPEDIWTKTTTLLTYSNGFPDEMDHEILARAILAERERCAQVLMTKHENHPQDGVMWDSTYYDLYEEILQVPR